MEMGGYWYSGNMGSGLSSAMNFYNFFRIFLKFIRYFHFFLCSLRTREREASECTPSSLW